MDDRRAFRRAVLYDVVHLHVPTFDAAHRTRDRDQELLFDLRRDVIGLNVTEDDGGIELDGHFARW